MLKYNHICLIDSIDGIDSDLNRKGKSLKNGQGDLHISRGQLSWKENSAVIDS
jgi:hypothetical protein